MTVEDKKCPVFVDGEECGHPLIRVDLEAKKIARYDLASCLASRLGPNASMLQPGSKLKRWKERRTKDTANSSGQESSLR
jgi:hypothetical protein